MKQAHAVILANSDTFSQPLERLLQASGSFVTAFFPETLDNEAIQAADIIIVAVGRPAFVTRDMIKSGACIIDVGTNRRADGKVVGDVDTEHVMDIPGWLSPVPGGVGPMTVALLLKNTLELAKQRIA
jgi:methylenetetrahydrofolate dehydrogenase (NADP+)/methenyltetrahydrofolate cyclohydrolase